MTDTLTTLEWGILGILITMVVAAIQIYQAKRSAQHAEDFADEARNTLRIIARALDQSGMAEITWEEGVPVSIQMHYRMKADPGRFQLVGPDPELRVTRVDGGVERP